MKLSDNMRGSVLMSASMAAFVTNDALMKLSFQSVPVAQALVIRGLVASIILLALAAYTGALWYRPPRRDRGPLAGRVIGEILGAGAFMLALAHMPIANATAVLQAAPLAVTMAAAIFLGEHVGWRRWAAICVGFLGMLVIVRPGSDGFSIYAIFAILTVFFITLRDLATRALSEGTPTLYASALSAAVVTVSAAIFLPIEGWAPMRTEDIITLSTAGVLVLLGYVTGVGSVRYGDVGAVAPFRYTVLIWALILGYLMFGEVLDWVTLGGAGIVAAAGLYTLWRERVVGQSIAAKTAPRSFMAGLRRWRSSKR
ncbi:MAG: DMT family transporter [Pseudomonadota bacterium]